MDKTDAAARSAPLDGVRALAVLGVLGFHAHYAGVSGGFLGVDVFFVLSGYLITKGLFREVDRSGGLAYGRFVARRAARLFPALAVAMCAVVPVGLLLGNGAERAAVARCTAAATGYGMNLPAAEGLGCSAMWHVTWSLASEQQFYLAWPVLLVGLLVGLRLSRRTAALACVTAYAGSVAWQVVLRGQGASVDRLLYPPDGASLVLLLGCGLALALPSPPVVRGWRVPAVDLVGLLAAAGLVLLFLRAPLASEPTGLPPLVLCGLGTAVLVACLVVLPPEARSARLLGAAPVAWVGRISYSLYLWHEVAYRLAEAVAPRGSATAEVLRFVLALLFAAASYRFVEQPALAWWVGVERRRAARLDLAPAARPQGGRELVPAGRS